MATKPPLIPLQNDKTFNDDNTMTSLDVAIVNKNKNENKQLESSTKVNKKKNVFFVGSVNKLY